MWRLFVLLLAESVGRTCTAIVRNIQSSISFAYRTPVVPKASRLHFTLEVASSNPTGLWIFLVAPFTVRGSARNYPRRVPHPLRVKYYYHTTTTWTARVYLASFFEGATFYASTCIFFPIWVVRVSMNKAYVSAKPRTTWINQSKERRLGWYPVVH